MTRRLRLTLVWALTISVIALPFLARGVRNSPPTLPAETSSIGADQLVIITPHLEAVRRKFKAGFARWYVARYHRPVEVEFLVYGGGEIVRFFQASEAAFARTGTYNVDVVWGGSDSMFNDVLKSKYLASFELDQAIMHAAFPRPDIGGVALYDPDSVQGPRWFGTALSSFGILYNRDLLESLGLAEPETWADLADPRYHGWLMLADPTQSSSAKAAFSVIVEREVRIAGQKEGWARGMGLVRQIAANARGFAAGANELPGIVSNGDAAATMSIDFYARSQIAAIGSDRLGYVEPRGATMITPEPVALARGAAHGEVGRRFIEFTLSEAGQRLWITRAGPGEPPEFSLHRLPIMPSLYQRPEANFEAATDPFGTAGGFNTDPARRRELGLVDELIARCCIDLLSELRATRAQINRSPRAAELDARLGRFPISEAESQAAAAVHAKMLNGEPQEWLALQRRWRERFRAEYSDLRRLAGERGVGVTASAPREGGRAR